MSAQQRTLPGGADDREVIERFLDVSWRYLQPMRPRPPPPASVFVGPRRPRRLEAEVRDRPHLAVVHGR